MFWSTSAACPSSMFVFRYFYQWLSKQTYAQDYTLTPLNSFKEFLWYSNNLWNLPMWYFLVMKMLRLHWKRMFQLTLKVWPCHQSSCPAHLPPFIRISPPLRPGKAIGEKMATMGVCTIETPVKLKREVSRERVTHLLILFISKGNRSASTVPLHLPLLNYV